jgi:protein O-GlcNAc transferase
MPGGRRLSPAAPDEAYQKAHALYSDGKREQAESHLRRFLQRQPRHAGANNLMAILLVNQGRIDRAAYHAQIAADADPRQVVYLNTLGVVLTHAQRPREAADVLRRATQVQPAYGSAWNSLGIALSHLGEVPAAEEAFATACRLAPQDPQPRINRAKLYLDTGRAQQTVSELRAALQLAPGHRQALSDLAGALNYTTVDPNEVFEVHRRLGMLLESHAQPSGQPRAAARAGGQRPRLRIGYISGDFRAHSVAYFVEPLLRAHDRSRFEVYCYHAWAGADEVTRRLKGLAQHWRDVASLADPQLAARIAQDRLDVLIDLSGHTAGNRLAALAFRTAPIQINWCGYANTTGLRTMDCRMVDEWTDPAGAESLATERLIRLPRCFLCYQPPAEAPLPPAPSSAGGGVTFGSFNILPKISPAAIALWGGAMNAAGNSRIIIKAKGIGLPGVRERLLAAFADAGVAPDRVELIEFLPTVAEHMSLYNRVDIALDTFPYHGTTTTCEALWMGVPVISRIGRVHASRVGLSLLTAVGLPHLAAADDAAFAATAAALASDCAARRELRTLLRGRMAASPLCDAAGFARGFESAVQAVVGL